MIMQTAGNMLLKNSIEKIDSSDELRTHKRKINKVILFIIKRLCLTTHFTFLMSFYLVLVFIC